MLISSNEQNTARTRRTTSFGTFGARVADLQCASASTARPNKWDHHGKPAQRLTQWDLEQMKKQ